MVGVDGSPGSSPAIRLAWQEARYRDTPLLAIMAYGGESAVLGTPAGRPVSTQSASDQREITETTLRLVVQDALGDQQAGVQQRAVQGLPGRALVEAAQETGAQLVVLAARNESTVARLLGTVSQHVLRHAPCPVLVVPAGVLAEAPG